MRTTAISSLSNRSANKYAVCAHNARPISCPSRQATAGALDAVCFQVQRPCPPFPLHSPTSPPPTSVQLLKMFAAVALHGKLVVEAAEGRAGARPANRDKDRESDLAAPYLFMFGRCVGEP